jgi:hypothetical protein
VLTAVGAATIAITFTAGPVFGAALCALAAVDVSSGWLRSGMLIRRLGRMIPS